MFYNHEFIKQWYVYGTIIALRKPGKTCLAYLYKLPALGRDLIRYL
jgi:hypothetical protein